MGDNIELFDRNGVRTPMQWDDSPNAGFTNGVPFAPVIEGDRGFQRINVASQVGDSTSLFHAVRHMVAMRKEHQVFGRGDMAWVTTDNPSIAAYTRKYQDETLLIINNLSGTSQTVDLPAKDQGIYVDLITNTGYKVAPTVMLEPYDFLWLKPNGN